jgi:autotransporter translocation and assembly factor TamB
MANQRISSRQINIVGYGVNAQCSGSLNVTGAGSLDYQGVAEILTKQGFFTNTLAKLSGATSNHGKLSFPFRVSGTIDNPKFSVAR